MSALLRKSSGWWVGEAPTLRREPVRCFLASQGQDGDLVPTGGESFG